MNDSTRCSAVDTDVCQWFSIIMSVNNRTEFIRVVWSISSGEAHRVNQMRHRAPKLWVFLKSLSLPLFLLFKPHSLQEGPSVKPWIQYYIQKSTRGYIHRCVRVKNVVGHHISLKYDIWRTLLDLFYVKNRRNILYYLKSDAWHRRLDINTFLKVIAIFGRLIPFSREYTIHDWTLV